MYDLVALIIILASFAVLASIAIKKFPALASLDVNNIPAEKEARFKERILSNRLKRNILKWYGRIARLLGPVGIWLVKFSRILYQRLLEMREKYKKDQVQSPVDLEKRIKQLFDEADELRKSEDYPNAEKRLIEVISLDSKNIKAFKELGKLYVDRKDFDTAKQTFEHVLKLKSDDEESYESLAMVAEAEGDWAGAKEEYLKMLALNNQRAQTYYELAIVCEETKDYTGGLEYIEAALNLEANSPRFLDTKLRISIIIKDKIAALDAYERLSTVNPENQKLGDLRREIDQL
jgi:tetratricopeptide (TPR) repeat protein